MKELECHLRSLQVTKFYLLHSFHDTNFIHSFRHSLESGIRARRLDRLQSRTDDYLSQGSIH